MGNQSTFNMIIWVLLLPLIGSIVQALIGKRVIDAMGPAKGRRLMGILAVVPIFAAFGIGFFLTQQLGQMLPDARSVRVEFFDWISLLSIRIPFEITVDTLSMTMVLIITGVGALIHLYATGYMGEERDYSRFFTYMNLFIACMLILVLGGNLALTFIGWEGVGLCSYLLIGFWYKDLANAKAANKAFIVNRIGDWGMTLGVFLIVALLVGVWDRLQMKSDRLLSYDVIMANANALAAYPAIITAIALLLFVGACGKSAQFPLYLWLPDAMAGPTPVSALIHAATMVTSGVFLLNRLHIFFELSQFASAIVAAIGAFTAFFAALIAFGQMDIKKVLAYSTVSQLGFMFIACGSGAYWAGMFHVTTHAFFKALLFLGAGAVIHAMAHNQDMRNYGGLYKYLPITFITMIIGTAAIAGVPLLSGAYSKEAIIHAALVLGHAEFQATLNNWIYSANLGMYAGYLGLLTAMLTAWYMTRLACLTFFSGKERWRDIEPHAHHEEHAHEHHEAHASHDHGPDTHGFFYTDEEMAAREAAEPHEHHHELDKNHTPKEVPISMWLPLVVLAALSVVAGRWMEGGGSEKELAGPFQSWLYPHQLSSEARPIYRVEQMLPGNMSLEMIAALAALVGIAAGLVFYFKRLPEREGWDISRWSKFRLWAGNQFGYDHAMVEAAVEGGNDVGRVMWLGVDAGMIDRFVNGLAGTAGAFGSMFRKVQTGFIRSYALMMLFGGVLLLAAMLLLLGGVH